MNSGLNTNPSTGAQETITPPPDTALVIFGASGDLTQRKLVPALANLAQDGYLPKDFYVVGASRTPFSDEEFRAKLKKAIDQFSRRPIEDEVWKNFSKNILYHATDGTDIKSFQSLKDKLDSLGAKKGKSLNYLYYLSTSPEFFGDISRNLKASGLIEDPSKKERRTSLIVEKPFGKDMPSAQALNQVLLSNFAEEQIFRIDHYLGKETVQNILVFRFANGIFEPLWNAKYIDHIEISFCEDFGVGSRAPYFDQNGILRDVVQNHLLQMLSLLCIEPPISLSDPDSIRNEKVKVLRMVKRITRQQVTQNVVRSQYTSGIIHDKPVIGYREEKGVNPQSMTDTAVALRLSIDNWRWAGVPIYLRAGKCLPKRITEISVLFKRAPGSLFSGKFAGKLEQNALSIQVQPKEGISLWVNSKPPGMNFRIKEVEMDFSYADSFGVASADAYERLLLDAMRGDATLFARNDEIEEAWDILSPIFSAWESDDAPPLYMYEAGSWGPQEADALLLKRHHQWRKL